MRRVRHAFTLVELLVVVAIIGLLLSILVPTLAGARVRAKVVVCASNLRQLGVAMELYAQSNRDRYPSWSVWHVWGYYGTEFDGTEGDSEGPAWTELLRMDGSLAGIDIYRCPSFPRHVPVSYFESARAAWLRYETRSTRKDWLRYTSEFVLGGDCTNPFFYAPPFGTNEIINIDDADMDDATEPCLDWNRPAHKDGGSNVLFADGHVSPYASFRKSEMTFDTIVRAASWSAVAAPPGP